MKLASLNTRSAPSVQPQEIRVSRFRLTFAPPEVRAVQAIGPHNGTGVTQPGSLVVPRNNACAGKTIDAIGKPALRMSNSPKAQRAAISRREMRPSFGFVASLPG
jgi:hypothetical protein